MYNRGDQSKGIAMKGNVIGFDPDTNTGAISGHDGQRYDFVTIDWHGRSQPRHGDVVDFQPEGQRAAQIYLVEATYMRPSITEFLFSANGRISRSQYWLKWALPLFVVTIVLEIILFATLDPSVVSIFIGIYSLLLIYPSIVIYIKRAHDRDRSGWFILLFLVPILNFWPLIELWFLRGTIGPNKYGPDPVVG
jgi:uncharacterized membrane protein YhaH (DUF805 family)